MSDLVFKWDPRKDTLNKEKHGVSFEEAKSVFYDECARLINDPDHSEHDDRFILLGFSSSRKATKSETKNYPRQT